MKSPYISLLMASLLLWGAEPGWTKAKPKEAASFQAGAAAWREVPQEPLTGKLSFDNTFPDQDWWRQFQDPLLTGYIEKALQANHTLAIAQARVTEARALARQSLGRELPTLVLAGNFSRQKFSSNLVAPNVNRQNATAFQGQVFAPGQIINTYNVPLQASYDVDLWLANRDRTRSAKQGLLAAEQQARSAVITVTTEVAAAYFNLLKADRLLGLQQDVIQLAQTDLEQTRAKADAGLLSTEAVRGGEAAVAEAQARGEDYARMRGLALNQLALLMGQSPGEVAALNRQTLEALPLLATVSAGVPAEIVTRRPDVLAAEADLERAHIEVRLARKAFLPTINVSGQFGFASRNLDNLFDWQSNLRSIGAALSQSLFSGGTRLAELRATQARQKQVLHQYQQTLLQAFREVEDALASLKASRNAHQNYATQRAAVEDQLSLQGQRADVGLLADSDLNPTRRQKLLVEQAQAETKATALVDQLSLYRALGGGF